MAGSDDTERGGSRCPDAHDNDPTEGAMEPTGSNQVEERLKKAERERNLMSKVFMDGADPIIIEDLPGT
jgi:hypothetical protein